MKRKLRFLQVLLSIILSIFCMVALIACAGKEPPVPQVTNVTITAVDSTSYGKAGALHQINYTAPEDSEISTSVQLNGEPATVADFVKTPEGLIFYTAGEYTVTVYASKNGMLGSGSVNITITEGAVSVNNVTISAAAGEAYGKVGALHLISYTATAGSQVEVEIKKDEALADDVIFNGEYNTVIFGSAGTYTVKVTATTESGSDSAQAQIEVTAAEAPTVSLSLNQTTVEEDGEVTLQKTVSYAGGDMLAGESVSVLYRADSTGSFLETSESSYTLIGDKFTPHLAGEWKLVYKVLGEKGSEGEASATLKCNPLALSLLPKATGLYRIQTATPAEIDYTVIGAADKYDISYDLHGATHVTASAGDGTSVRINASEVDYFTVTIVYTHKVVTTLQEKLDITVYSVDSLTYAPAWGEDPFDGMPSDVLTSMGHLLYFNATSRGGNKRELTAENATFEVIEHNVTASSGGTGVEILYGAGDNGAYPYVIVTNFDNNVAQGDFTLKMTLTDPYTGYSAVATKKFNVLPTSNNNANAAKFIVNYINQHSDFYDMGSMDYSNLCSDCRHNMILTKTGAIMQRSNPSWTLNNNNADFAQMDLASASQNNRLEFKFKLLAPNPVSGEAWLGIGMRTVNTNGWAGFFDLHIVSGRLDITNGLNQRPSTESKSAAERPLAQNGATLYVRIDRRVNGSVAEYTVYAKTEANAPYEQYYRCTYAVSTSAGNPGAPVKQYQFTHRNAGGCYAVEEVNVTDFGA